MFEMFGAYSEFAQKYCEIKDDYRNLIRKIEELKLWKMEVPIQDLIDHNQKFVLINELEKMGLEKYDKLPNEIYKDGKNYWIKEDRFLTEKQYGKK